MPSPRLRITALCFVFAALPLSGALADRGPTADERARIEATLKSQGFTRWGKIEFDDGRYWEVDDAYAADGLKYDLDLSADGGAIIRRDRDD